MLTSKDGLFDKAGSRVVGSDQYLAKPFTGKELLGAVKRLGESTQKIGDIVELLNGIAVQANVVYLTLPFRPLQPEVRARALRWWLTRLGENPKNPPPSPAIPQSLRDPLTQSSIPSALVKQP